MNGPSISEYLARIAIVLGPVLVAGAFIQYWLLRRAGVRLSLSLLAVFVAAILTVALSDVMLLLSIRLSLFGFGFGNPLVIPVLLAAGVVTVAVFGYARSRRAT